MDYIGDYLLANDRCICSIYLAEKQKKMIAEDPSRRRATDKYIAARSGMAEAKVEIGDSYWVVANIYRAIILTAYRPHQTEISQRRKPLTACYIRL
ncbi:MAG: hypothetical protein EAZ60_21705 [Oscillatoriales cyanobacterium]|nr:MAG: hypothetical protein EAZ83_14790 [Oscillatoriales cyanobacterium]TAE97379.1 MAG: hypothetical protein EAZ79_11050 [Oscillatoriales cyanobacterium]TAF18955.1 MAG: hypothetical protein EAZ73_16585 [Oscillatoriales cyanobacterium]TAF37323.1 MAG: hypothetical protein EAZ69_07415 [Oscillatoriales cyanobacterium]TAF53053.1 MAG: hypothetical protein EAZ60_21705 [Oscillatoriales cyanobacterium]